MLKELNSLMQKVNKFSKIVSDLNALEQAFKGNKRSLNKKIDNKVKNYVWRKIK